MKVQINHYIPEEDKVQQDLFEDVKEIATSRDYKDESQIISLVFKYGSENYKKFNHHGCSIYLDNLDLVLIVED